jgi:hypothetical protein
MNGNSIQKCCQNGGFLYTAQSFGRMDRMYDLGKRKPYPLKNGKEEARIVEYIQYTKLVLIRYTDLSQIRNK